MKQPPQSISTTTLLDIINNKRIGAEYQPIKDTHSLETIGHEALARFYSRDNQALPPQIVFDALHDSPITLVQVELLSKHWQLANAPNIGKLFINLDPHAVSGISHTTPDHPILSLLTEPARIVVELIENTNIQEADHSLILAELLAKQQIQVALDDIGGPNTMLSLPILSCVNIMKFDRQWLRMLHQAEQRHMLGWLLDFARQTGKLTILEGVETAEDLAQARAMGVDYVQGYLFRDEFITRRATMQD